MPFLPAFAVAAFAIPALLWPAPAQAVIDPITSALSKGVAVAMDIRSTDDVAADVEIDTDLSKKLSDTGSEEFEHIAVLVFARQVVLVGFAKSDAVRRKAVALTARHKLARNFKNDIVVGSTDGGLLGNLWLDKKIDLALTATEGVRSVNMRWKVYGGHVFLMGVAQSKTEAALAIKTIQGLDGVKTVRSSLRIGKS